MGAAEARMFAREGAKVGIADILEDEGRRLEAESPSWGGEAIFIKLDATSEDDWNRAVDTIVSRFGKLDVLVNNAGIYRRGTVENTSVEDWDQIMDVNAKGVFLGTKAAIPAMRRAGAAPSSTYPPPPVWWVAQGSRVQRIQGRGATAHQSDSHTVRKEGIRTNSVHPGPIETDMLAQVYTQPSDARTRLSNIRSVAPAGQMTLRTACCSSRPTNHLS